MISKMSGKCGGYPSPDGNCIRVQSRDSPSVHREDECPKSREARRGREPGSPSPGEDRGEAACSERHHKEVAAGPQRSRSEASAVRTAWQSDNTHLDVSASMSDCMRSLYSSDQ